MPISVSIIRVQFIINTQYFILLVSKRNCSMASQNPLTLAIGLGILD